jgi:hypothetical protein
MYGHWKPVQVHILKLICPIRVLSVTYGRNWFIKSTPAPRVRARHPSRAQHPGAVGVTQSREHPLNSGKTRDRRKRIWHLPPEMDFTFAAGNGFEICRRKWIWHLPPKTDLTFAAGNGFDICHRKRIWHLPPETDLTFAAENGFEICRRTRELLA